MATLTDTFLADLDDLSDGSGDDVPVKEDEKSNEMEEGGGFIDFDAVKIDDINAIATLATSSKYQATLAKVREEENMHGDAMPSGWAGPSEADPLYRLIVTCNELAMSIDDEIAKVHAFIREKFKRRFPELDGLVLEPLAYARVVQRIGNTDNVIAVDLDDVIPRHIQMTVSVSASTTDGQPLPEVELQRVMEACSLMDTLDADRSKLLWFVGVRLALVAPNLSEVCGTDVAAKLVGAAGGLSKLSEIPACNIQVLGQKKRINAGLSSANVGANQGYVYAAPIVCNVPPDYRRKAAKLVGNKVALLARFDAFGTSETRNSDQGKRIKAEMEKTVEKWMEPPPAAIAKPLARPDAEGKKRRGGRRWRKMKERVATTEMMKQANRMEFGKVEEEYVDGDEMYGLGMLGKDGHGKLKVMQAASKISKKEKALRKGGAAGMKGAGGGVGGLLSGTASTLAFSHVQGIELENPNREEEQGDVGGTRSGTESYFSELSGFKTFRKVS